jgi:hypothetical protein
LKLFILLIIVVFVCAFLFLRLRPYFLLAKRMLNFARDARDINGVNVTPQSSRRAQSSSNLSRCAACGIWIPTSRALTLRSSSAVYCSTDCLERSAGAAAQHDNQRAAGTRL